MSQPTRDMKIVLVLDIVIAGVMAGYAITGLITRDWVVFGLSLAGCVMAIRLATRT